MLESPHHDARRDAELISERDDGRGCYCRRATKEGVIARAWDQRLRGESISLLLARIRPTVEPFDEDLASAMAQHVAQLMEQREPKDIRPLPSKTELNEHLVRSEPSRCTVGARLRQVRKEDQSDPASGQLTLHSGLEGLGLCPRERAQFWQEVLKALLTECISLHLLCFEASAAKPGGQRFRSSRVSSREPICHGLRL